MTARRCAQRLAAGAAALVLAQGLAAQAVAPDAPRLLRVEPPRDTGRHLGDLLPYRALLHWPAGWDIDRDGLPARDQEGRPMSLHGHRVLPAAASEACDPCRWLVLDWQVFKAVRMTEDVPLPAAELRLRQGSQVVTLTLPAARVAVSPLVPWERRRDWLDSVRPGWQASPYDVAAVVRQGVVLATLAALCFAAWAWTSGRWLPRARSRPFAQAWGALRARHRRDAAAPAQAEDLRLWHRAFDATAGRAVLAEDLPAFFDQHPAFAPLAPECTAMFAASQRFFFLQAPTILLVSDLSDLLRRLAACEFGQRSRRGRPAAAPQAREGR